MKAGNRPVQHALMCCVTGCAEGRRKMERKDVGFSLCAAPSLEHLVLIWEGGRGLRITEGSWGKLKKSDKQETDLEVMVWDKDQIIRLRQIQSLDQVYICRN